MIRGTMLFSQIERYTFKPQSTHIEKIKNTARFDMISRIQNIKSCGKCKGAK
jgi:hypothetical protein